MMKTFQRGFTLIELLVVIAIIGILAAVVLSSLNDARQSGQDASLQQSMTSLRSQAELYYNQNDFAYDGMCADPDVQSLLDAILDNSPATSLNTTDSTASAATTVTCRDSNTEWAVTAPLSRLPGEEDPTRSFCVDYTGDATTSAVAVIAAGEFRCD